MNQPLYRWKSFWFGVLVVAFLGWSWTRSMHHIDGIIWHYRNFIVTAGQTRGLVYMSESHPVPPIPFAAFNSFHKQGTEGEPWFPRALTLEAHGLQTHLTFAHWFLILLFLVPWSGWLAWRSRKLKKLVAPQN